MSKRSLWIVLGGVTAALLAPIVAGCSSPGGCRTCRKEPGVPARASAANTVVAPLPTQGNSLIADRPFGGQKNCPVTGEELGSMGKPVAVTVMAQTVYVCCRGCAAKAMADPDKTLAAVAAERAR